MLKTFTSALFALTLSVGWAQAQTMHHKHHHMIPGCTMGAAATAKCACGTMSGKPVVCQAGQWCHTDHACTM